MKKWNNPEIEVLGLEATKLTENINVDSDGFYEGDDGNVYAGFKSGATNENNGQ